MSNVSKCKDCKHSVCNTGDKLCSKGCPKGKPFEPVEKTYNLLELEEGEEYSCDESPSKNKYKIMGGSLHFQNSATNGGWNRSDRYLSKKTFRKIKKKLTFKDLEAGAHYVSEKGTTRDYKNLDKDVAIFEGSVGYTAWKECEIANWSKKQ